MEEMLKRLASYGCVQSGPPMRTRCSSAARGAGAIEWVRNS